MRKSLSSCKWIVGAVALASVAAIPGSTQAANVTLNVQSVTSSVTLSGLAFGLNYTQQNAGSLTASWNGTISADLTGGVFTFSGGSSISAIVNPSGPYTTFPNAIGTEAGNYGVTAFGDVPALLLTNVTVNGVYKNLVLNITAGTAQNGLAPSGVTMNFTSGALDYGASNPAPITSGTSSLVNVSGLNTSASLVSWNGTTLILPVTFQTTGSNRIENWNGTITATLAAVPEPTTIALLGLLGVGGVAGAIYRRRRMTAGLEQDIRTSR